MQPEFEEIFRKDYRLKGRWREDFFGNPNPIVLELGCGRGEYTVSLAERFSDRNFIGVDIKGARLWRGAKTATENAMPNVAFLRTRIEFIDSFFAPGEVDEIWITFPDPQLRKNRVKKRLTAPLFLEALRPFPEAGRGDSPENRLATSARLYESGRRSQRAAGRGRLRRHLRHGVRRFRAVDPDHLREPFFGRGAADHLSAFRSGRPDPFRGPCVRSRRGTLFRGKGDFPLFLFLMNGIGVPSPDRRSLHFVP